MVVDFLASPGPFNTPLNVEALTPEMLRNAQASGITAVNLTIGGVTPQAVFESMARWERDIERHPDVLMKIRTIGDLQTAKQQKAGPVCGFQGRISIDSDLVTCHAFAHRPARTTCAACLAMALQPENGD
jgi:hypothetical protein